MVITAFKDTCKYWKQRTQNAIPPNFFCILYCKHAEQLLCFLFFPSHPILYHTPLFPFVLSSLDLIPLTNSTHHISSPFPWRKATTAASAMFLTNSLHLLVVLTHLFHTHKNKKWRGNVDVMYGRMMLPTLQQLMSFASCLIYLLGCCMHPSFSKIMIMMMMIIILHNVAIFAQSQENCLIFIISKRRKVFLPNARMLRYVTHIFTALWWFHLFCSLVHSYS